MSTEYYQVNNHSRLSHILTSWKNTGQRSQAHSEFQRHHINYEVKKVDLDYFTEEWLALKTRDTTLI